MNIISNKIKEKKWTLPVFLMSLLLGQNVVFARESQLCTDATINEVAHWAEIPQKQHPVVDSACKLMPNSPKTIIAVIAFNDNNLPAEDGGVKIKVTALIENGKVVAADKSTIEEDSLTVVDDSSLSIDTAPYILAPGIRAFATIFDSGSSGPSCPDFNAEKELTLWVREGSKLRPVFGTNIYGWVNLDQNWCNKHIESAHMIISVGKHGTHGFADLTLTAHVVRSDDTKDGYVESGKRVVRRTLHYDGKSYGSDMFREFWYPKSIDSRAR